MRSQSLMLPSFLLEMLIWVANGVVDPDFRWLLDFTMVVGFAGLFFGWWLARKGNEEFYFELRHGYSTAGLLSYFTPPKKFSSRIALVNPFSGHVVCAYDHLDYAVDQVNRDWFADSLVRECERWESNHKLPNALIQIPGYALGAIESISYNLWARLLGRVLWDIEPLSQIRGATLEKESLLLNKLPVQVSSSRIEKVRHVKFDHFARAWTTKRFQTSDF